MSKDKRKQAPAEPKQYRMPQPEIGDVIHFRHVANDVPSPAIVMTVSDRSIDVLTFRETTVTTLKDAVRHISDPELIRPAVAQRGMWSYPPRMARLLDLLEKLAPEEEEVEEPDDLPVPPAA